MNDFQFINLVKTRTKIKQIKQDDQFLILNKLLQTGSNNILFHLEFRLAKQDQIWRGPWRNGKVYLRWTYRPQVRAVELVTDLCQGRLPISHPLGVMSYLGPCVNTRCFMHRTVLLKQDQL